MCINHKFLSYTPQLLKISQDAYKVSIIFQLRVHHFYVLRVPFQSLSYFLPYINYRPSYHVNCSTVSIYVFDDLYPRKNFTAKLVSAKPHCIPSGIDYTNMMKQLISMIDNLALNITFLFIVITSTGIKLGKL